MKYLTLIILFYSIAVLSEDRDPLIEEYETLLSNARYLPLSDHSFCYNQGDGVQGQNIDRPKKIASVTKLFTTYLASEALDLNQIYETKIFIAGDKLHIDGSNDPYFEEEKMLLLLKSLNNLGYKSFKSVSFDSDFMFYDIGLEAHEEISPAKTKLRIQTYFNKKSINLIKSMMDKTKKFAEEEGIYIDNTITPSVHATTVLLSEKNPLINLSPSLFIHRSKPLHQILKSMNVMSKNVVAQNIYNQAQKIKKLSKLLVENGVDVNTFNFFNGSGLPLKKGKVRIDNLATCRTVLKLISLLPESLKKHHLAISDIMAVNGGKDLGSLRERFVDYPETHQAVLAKTGTLSVGSALAGTLMTDKNISFAIFNHTSRLAPIKKLQDTFVTRMFHHLGEPRPIDYFKIPIFPWDGIDFIVQVPGFY
jgi:D-alanyl-D-alanine carboxypeptidase/D-alanyl-D-alanine-endopeptidase (penicillin-binding protein 4)